VDSFNSELERKNNHLSNTITKLKKIINVNEQNFYLIYLYAAPLLKKYGGETNSPINYRKEIKSIVNIFNKTGNAYNCLFECANERLFTDILRNSNMKVLHISSHGEINKENKYSLILEDNTQKQDINSDQLENILKINSSKIENIDLVFVSTCYSEELGELFLKYGAKNVIYITSETPISNIASLKFTELFYQELVNNNSVKDSFDRAKEKLEADREVIYKNKNKCCCSHKHADNCYIKNKNSNRRSDTHKNFHKKECFCHFSEFHIHKLNCPFYEKVKKKN
jgi:CHAT domain-containing protein